MHLRAVLFVVLAGGFAFAACGSSGSTATPGGTTPSTIYKVAGVNPSNSSKMVCQPEAQKELADTLGVKATRVTTPTWIDQVYSCTYVYPNGSYTLSVKEMSSEQSTTDYYNAQKKKLGAKENLFGLGQGAFIAKNDDVVVRKDYKVLVVDVQKAPKGNGEFIPAMQRKDVSSNIAAVIMGCWQDT